MNYEDKQNAKKLRKLLDAKVKKSYRNIALSNINKNAEKLTKLLENVK